MRREIVFEDGAYRWEVVHGYPSFGRAVIRLHLLDGGEQTLEDHVELNEKDVKRLLRIALEVGLL